MNTQSEEMRRELERIFASIPDIRAADIPGIDLYMDQVTTFLQRNLKGLSRDPEGDKFLTKTMINNYVKNRVLLPPVKKKYSRDHMLLLIMIYYMKSFLSIGDIRSITAPIMERYAPAAFLPVERKKDALEKKREGMERARGHMDKKGAQVHGSRQESFEADRDTPDPVESGEPGISDIYEAIAGNFASQLPMIREGILTQIEYAEKDFSGVPEQDRPLLQRFSLICRLSAEICIRKLFIEKLLDSGME